MNEFLEREYFEWLCDQVNDLKPNREASYSRLLDYLFKIEFTYTVPMDNSRYVDGIDLRYRFGKECYGNDYREVVQNLDYKPCSVLEMMIALASKIDRNIMYDFDIGDRTGKWFWEMILNLGLGQMSDRFFNERRVKMICNRLLNREYERNGKGGLFVIYERGEDMRTVDIWYQAMWYLTENYY